MQTNDVHFILRELLRKVPLKKSLKEKSLERKTLNGRPLAEMGRSMLRPYTMSDDG
jgi:hypothetical protein